MTKSSVFAILALIGVCVNGQTYKTNPNDTDANGQDAIFKGVLACGDTVDDDTSDGRHFWQVNFTNAGAYVSFSLCDNKTRYDTGISVWKNDPRLSDDNFDMTDSNDDYCGLKSLDTVYTSSGVDPYYCYYVQVGGYYTNQGRYFLSMTCDPDSDETTSTSCDEEVIDGYVPPAEPNSTSYSEYSSSYLVPPDVTGGWGEALFQGDLGCAENHEGNTYSGRHYWKITFSRNDNDAEFIQFSLCNNGTDYDSGISIWQSDNGTYERLASNDQYCQDKSKIALETYYLWDEYEYYFQIGGYSDFRGNYELSVKCFNEKSPSSYLAAPDDDGWGQAAYKGGLSCNDELYLDDTKDSQERHYFAINTDIPEQFNWVTFTMCEENSTKYDSGLSLWAVEGGNDYYYYIDSNDEYCGHASRIVFEAKDFRDYLDYYLLVGGYLEYYGDYGILMQCTANYTDDRYTTTPITTYASNFLAPPDYEDEYGEARYRGIIKCGDVFVDDTSSGEDDEMRDFYQIDLSETGATEVTFTVCSNLTQYDSGLSFWRRDPENEDDDDGSEYNKIDDNDDYCGLRSELFEQVEDMSDEYCYYILVGGYWDEVGPYQLSMICDEGDVLEHPVCSHEISDDDDGGNNNSSNGSDEGALIGILVTVIIIVIVAGVGLTWYFRKKSMSLEKQVDRQIAASQTGGTENDEYTTDGAGTTTTG